VVGQGEGERKKEEGREEGGTGGEGREGAWKICSFEPPPPDP
jgi:hypothetical protein